MQGVLDPGLLGAERIRPLRRVEFERLAALGYFDDERVELLDGVVVEMTPPGPDHCNPIDLLGELFMPLAMAGRARIRTQQPLGGAGESLAQPDLALVPRRDYDDAHPDDAMLVVEVAVSSLAKDRRAKAPLYARSGFPEYWIVNVPERVIEVHRDPIAGEYRLVTRHAIGESIRPLAFPDLAVAVGDVLR